MTRRVSFAMGAAVGVCYAVVLHKILFGLAIGAALAGLLSTRSRALSQDVQQN
jgi:hypothetical protein